MPTPIKAPTDLRPGDYYEDCAFHPCICTRVNVDDDEISFLKLERWEPSQRKAALRALTDALPEVKSNLALDRLVACLLEAMGGGELKVAVRGSRAVVDVKAQRTPNGSGVTFATSSENVSPESVSRAARQCREALRVRYPELR